MRLFSKIVFICNICFYISLIGRLWMINRPVAEGSGDVVKLDPFISSVVALGWIAIFLNIAFVLLFLFRFPSKRMDNLGRFIIFFNLIALPAQIFYYFFSKF